MFKLECNFLASLHKSPTMLHAQRPEKKQRALAPRIPCRNCALNNILIRVVLLISMQNTNGLHGNAYAEHYSHSLRFGRLDSKRLRIQHALLSLLIEQISFQADFSAIPTKSVNCTKNRSQKVLCTSHVCHPVFPWIVPMIVGRVLRWPGIVWPAARQLNFTKSTLSFANRRIASRLHVDSYSLELFPLWSVFCCSVCRPSVFCLFSLETSSIWSKCRIVLQYLLTMRAKFSKHNDDNWTNEDRSQGAGLAPAYWLVFNYTLPATALLNNFLTNGNQNVFIWKPLSPADASFIFLSS